MRRPLGAIIQAVITVYNTIQFFIERAKQIAAFVGAVFNSIAEIAGGNIGKAVAAVENALAKGVPVAISFLANLIGLGGIAKKVQEIIKKIRKPIDKVIGKVVGFVVGKAKQLYRKVTGAVKGEEKESPEKLEKVNRGLAAIDQEEKKYLENSKISREDAEKVAITVKKAHWVFKSITVVDGEETWDYDYVASPGRIRKGHEQSEKDKQKDINRETVKTNKLKQLPKFEGGKTSGILEANGFDVPLTSGVEGPAKQFQGIKVPGMNLVTKTHVEGHAAAYMRLNSIKEATLYINNPPCLHITGCNNMLSRMLPEGSKLKVIAPNGYKKIFIGFPD